MDFLKNIGIKCQNEQLLITALTHSSFANENHLEDYERLEFLGDAVLQIIISEYLYLNTKFKEGEMTKLRAAYVCEEALSEYSKKMNIMPYVRLGEGQKRELNDTILADMFESIVGAIYLSEGINEAKKLIKQIAIPYIKQGYRFVTDYKSLLQELIQTSKENLEYVLIKESGPAHDKSFFVEVQIGDITYGKGQGKTKKEAEQNAAKSAWEKRAN